MENWMEGFARVFSRRIYAMFALALFALLLPAYAVLTDIVLLSPFSLNPGIKFPEAALVIAISMLASLGFTLAAFQIFELRAVSRKSVGGSVLGAGVGGTALAAFASACSVCQPIWLFWLGLGSATAFLADYGIFILAASAAMLVYSIDAGLKAVAGRCRAKPRKKRWLSISY